MSFGAKHECARLKEELVSAHAQLNKLKDERDTLAQTLQKEWARYEVLRSQYAHKALQYDSLAKKLTVVQLAAWLTEWHKLKVPDAPTYVHAEELAAWLLARLSRFNT